MPRRAAARPCQRSIPPSGLAVEGTDFHAVSHGNISVTPIHLDLTNYASFDALRALVGSWC